MFLDLLPGGAPVKKSASQYQALLATVRPRDTASKTCRRMAAEELEGLARLDAKLQAMKAELKAAVQATGSRLMDIHSIGPAGAARVLADAGDVARFPVNPFRKTPTAHAQLRSPGERANAQLKTWRILRELRCCSWRAGQLAKAIHALQAREVGG